MNAKKLIAAAAMFAVAGSTFAVGSTEFEDNVNFHSTKTRAEVIAELTQAKADGSYVVGGEAYAFQNTNSGASDASGQTRTAVAQAQPGNDTIASGKTRAQVIDELVQAQADGSYVVGGEAYVGQLHPSENSRAPTRLARSR